MILSGGLITYALTQGGGNPNIESITIVKNGTYTATDCDGYSPICVNVEKSYDSLQEASEDFYNSEITADDNGQNVIITVTTEIVKIGADLSANIKGGLMDKDTSTFINNKWSGMTIGANPKNIKVSDWYIKDGKYWFDISYSNDVYPSGKILSIQTPITETELSNFKIEKVR